MSRWPRKKNKRRMLRLQAERIAGINDDNSLKGGQ